MMTGVGIDAWHALIAAMNKADRAKYEPMIKSLGLKAN
jgi:hypothetical protein